MLKGSSGNRWGAGTPINPSGNLNPPPPTLKPDPPTSYSSTGTVTIGAALDNSSAGIYALFHPTWQKVVRNPSGIFAVYASNDNGNHDPSAWKMKYCPASSDFTVAANWSTLWDSNAKGDPQYGVCPAIETDENNNIYVIANYLPQLGETFSGVKMYKFTHASGYAAPGAPITLCSGGLSSGKWATFLDQSRGWIWVCFWEFGTSPTNGTNLMAFDYTGTQVYSRKIFKTFTRKWSPTLNGATDLHGPSAHYCALWVGGDGTVYVGWNNLVCEAGDFTNAALSYYDVRMVYSPGPMNGSETWYGPTNGVSGDATARTIPFCSDDSATDKTEQGYQIVKTSNQDEFIPASNSSYGFGTGKKFNFNRLYAMALNGSNVHFYYESETSNASAIQHHSYARLRLSSHDVSDSERRTPNFNYDTTTSGDRLGAAGGQSGGSFIQDTTMANRLYFVQKTSRNADQAVRILRSDDNGVSWWLYATSGAFPGGGSNGLLEPQAYRWVQSDGIIMGIVALADSPYTVYTFKVVPS